MECSAEHTFTAFQGHHRVASGSMLEVALILKDLVDVEAQQNFLIFDDLTGKQIDLDLSGTSEEITGRYGCGVPLPNAEKNARGRPRLGVVAREVTLLPGHWEWLGAQSGGASATIRRLVEKARKENADQDEIRRAREATYKFMTAIGGNLPHYEEALRALYGGQRLEFLESLKDWPADIHRQVQKLAGNAFPGYFEDK